MKPIEAIQRAMAASKQEIDARETAIAENQNQIDEWHADILKARTNIDDCRMALKALGAASEQ